MNWNCLNVNKVNLFLLAPKKKRGRKPKDASLPRKVKLDVDHVLSKPSSPVLYVPSSDGTMNLLYNKHHFAFHFNKSSVAHWRCVQYHKTGCTARVLVRDKRLYPAVVTHNHQDISFSRPEITVLWTTDLH